MGKIKKILENELVGGTQSTDVYPVTSVKAVYDENNERLDNILNRRGVVNISTNYNSEHTAEVLTLAQALSKVPSTDRVLGFQGKYLASDGWHTIIYIGDSLTSWSDTTKWINLADKVFNSISKNATFAGIATPTTNPGTPDGNVFYLATEVGIYSNFNNIEVTKGEAVIFKWNNGAWSKNVTGFAVQEKLLELESEVNQQGIYDVSAHNGGAVFESLSALLSDANLSTLIPTSVRHGGMSIKFIQLFPATYTVVKSADTTAPSGTEILTKPAIENGVYTADQLSAFGNLPASTGTSNAITYWYQEAVGKDPIEILYTKWVITKANNDVNQYVQYRLMSTSWSTNVWDWQTTFYTDDNIKYEKIETRDEKVIIKDNEGNEIVNISPDGVNAKNLKRNGKDVLTEDDVTGFATKQEVQQDIEKIYDTYGEPEEIQDREEYLEIGYPDDPTIRIREKLIEVFGTLETEILKVGSKVVSEEMIEALADGKVRLDDFAGKKIGFIGDSYAASGTPALEGGETCKQLYKYYFKTIHPSVTVVDKTFSGTLISGNAQEGGAISQNANYFVVNYPVHISELHGYLINHTENVTTKMGYFIFPDFEEVNGVIFNIDWNRYRQISKPYYRGFIYLYVYSYNATSGTYTLIGSTNKFIYDSSDHQNGCVAIYFDEALKAKEGECIAIRVKQYGKFTSNNDEYVDSYIHIVEDTNYTYLLDDIGGEGAQEYQGVPLIQLMKYSDLDYLIMQGGLNDYYTSVDIGELSNSVANGQSFDVTKFCGALDYMFCNVCYNLPFVRKGFIIMPQPMEDPSAQSGWGLYVTAIKEACKKWGIRCLDLNEIYAVYCRNFIYTSSNGKSFNNYPVWGISTDGSTNMHPEVLFAKQMNRLIASFIESL